MGLGVVLRSPPGVIREESARAAGTGCNNEAELHALCLALDLAWVAGARQLIVHGDSDVTVRYVTGAGKTSVVRLLPLIARAQQAMVRFDRVELLWLPRHRNADADRLSRQALGLVAGVAPTPVRGRRR